MKLFAKIWAWIKGLFTRAKTDVDGAVHDVEHFVGNAEDKVVSLARTVTADAKADVASAANAVAGVADDVEKKVS